MQGPSQGPSPKSKSLRCRPNGTSKPVQLVMQCNVPYVSSFPVNEVLGMWIHIDGHLMPVVWLNCLSSVASRSEKWVSCRGLAVSKGKGWVFRQPGQQLLQQLGIRCNKRRCLAERRSRTAVSLRPCFAWKSLHLGLLPFARQHHGGMRPVLSEAKEAMEN